jgi:probable rRNA maturation factor
VIILEMAMDADRAELGRFARRAQRLAGVEGEVAVLITDSRGLRSLNRRFRKKDKATDVLSFPRETGGDIAISGQIAADNARRYGHELCDELKILMLHGMLHLAGLDHESDQGEMAARESALRKRLKLPDSLIDRAAVNAGIRSRVRKASPSSGRRA